MQTKGRRVIGNKGESQAEEYLFARGLDVLERNYCIKGGEIDVIAKDKSGTVVFVEVKLRSSDTFGTGAEAVNSVKQKRMIKAAEKYLFENNLTDTPARFDIVEINNGFINWIINAFETF